MVVVVSLLDQAFSYNSLEMLQGFSASSRTVSGGAMIGWRLAERDPHYYNGC